VSVTEVKAFSMSDLPVTLWALGKAGWFEILPAQEYQSVYKKMTDGITLYYALVDIYENAKTSQSHKSMDMSEILKQVRLKPTHRMQDAELTQIIQYSKGKHNPVNLAKFTKICSENALFLFSQMLKPNEPVRWSSTKLFKWLLGSFSVSLTCSSISPHLTSKGYI
jgi:hypothetical protein